MRIGRFGFPTFDSLALISLRFLRFVLLNFPRIDSLVLCCFVGFGVKARALGLQHSVRQSIECQKSAIPAFSRNVLPDDFYSAVCFFKVHAPSKARGFTSSWLFRPGDDFHCAVPVPSFSPYDVSRRFASLRLHRGHRLSAGDRGSQGIGWVRRASLGEALYVRRARRIVLHCASQTEVKVISLCPPFVTASRRCRDPVVGMEVKEDTRLS